MLKCAFKAYDKESRYIKLQNYDADKEAKYLAKQFPLAYEVLSCIMPSDTL